MHTMRHAQAVPTIRGLHPASGDLVVRHDGSRRYTLHQVPGSAQLAFATRDEAERSARAFALHQGLDVWFEGDDRFAPLYRFRR